jgi:hypothetical protein
MRTMMPATSCHYLTSATTTHSVDQPKVCVTSVQVPLGLIGVLDDAIGASAESLRNVAITPHEKVQMGHASGQPRIGTD